MVLHVSVCLSKVRSSIPVQRICAVERVDENAFQQQNMMQVVTQDNDGQLHTMYILCKVPSQASLILKTALQE